MEFFFAFPSCYALLCICSMGICCIGVRTRVKLLDMPRFQQPCLGANAYCLGCFLATLIMCDLDVHIRHFKTVCGLIVGKVCKSRM